MRGAALTRTVSLALALCPPHPHVVRRAHAPAMGATRRRTPASQRSRPRGGRGRVWSGRADSVVSLNCEHFGECPGCEVADGLGEPPLLTEARAFFASYGANLVAVAGDTARGWRTTARLAVRRDTDGAPTVGLFARGTHEVVGVPRCVVHHPAINAVVAMLQAELRGGALEPYDEVSGGGQLRYVQASVERASGGVQLTLVLNAREIDGGVVLDPDVRAAAEALCARLWSRGGLHSIWANAHAARSNAILSFEPGAWTLLRGEPELMERLPSGAVVALPPYAFRQANLGAFDRVIASVRRLVPGGARVVEWYAGVGMLGLALAPQAEWVRCSDFNPMLDAPFRAGAALLPAEHRARVSFALGTAAERIGDAAGATCAVVDPPRKGLDRPLLDALCAPAAEPPAPCDQLRTLVYVSCGFGALRRDAAALLSAGWKIARGTRPEAHVLFLGANHIEAVVAFERNLSADDDAALTSRARTVAHVDATRR